MCAGVEISLILMPRSMFTLTKNGHQRKCGVRNSAACASFLTDGKSMPMKQDAKRGDSEAHSEISRFGVAARHEVTWTNVGVHQHLDQQEPGQRA